jgi:predicted phosphodiesterase
MDSFVVWSDLEADTQQLIVEMFVDGDEVDTLAREFGLRSSSLSRKLRELQSARNVDSGTRRTATIGTEREKRVMVYSDAHFPIADEKALVCAKIVRDLYRPDVIINLGDTLDMYSFSRFAKTAGRKQTFQDEIDAWKGWADWFYDDFTGQSLIVSGNHDHRLAKTVSGLGGLSDMQALGLESILDSASYGSEYVYDMIMVNPKGDLLYPDADMIFTHGSSAKTGSGASVRALTGQLSQTSAMMGHVHRTGVVVSRSLRGPIKSYEVGCLSTLDVDWAMYPDWSQSVMLGVVSEQYIDFSPVVFDRGKFVYAGVMFHSEDLEVKRDGWKWSG